MSRNLAIIRMTYSPYGGAETSIEQLRLALEQSRIALELTMLTQSWPQQVPEAKFISKHVTFPRRGITRASRFRHFSRSIQVYLEHKQIAITQTHERIPGCDIFRAGDGVHASWLSRLAQARRVPKALLALDPYHRLQLLSERAISIDPRTVLVANSPLIRSELESILGADPSRIRLIPNMIRDVSKGLLAPEKKHGAKCTLGFDPMKPVVIFLGSGFERKGAFQLIEAASHAREIQVLVIGKDRNPEKLQRRVNELGLTKRVKHLGPQTNLEHCWAASDIFCLPSLYDSFPNSALEALAHGIPCVLSDGVGIVDDWVASSVALKATRDPITLAATIVKMLSNIGTFRSKTLEKARTYSPERVMPLWLDLYESILAQKP